VQAVIDAIHESQEQGWQGTFPEKHAKKYLTFASTPGSQIDVFLNAHRNKEADQPAPLPPRGLPCP